MKSKPTALGSKIVLDGEEYSLRFDFEAIATAEELTGRPLLTALDQRMLAKPTIAEVRAMLFACLLPGNPEVEFSAVAKLVTRKTIVRIWGAVLAAWTESMDDREVEEQDDSPTLAQS